MMSRTHNSRTYFYSAKSTQTGMGLNRHDTEGRRCPLGQETGWGRVGVVGVPLPRGPLVPEQEVVGCRGETSHHRPGPAPGGPETPESTQALFSTSTSEEDGP